MKPNVSRRDFLTTTVAGVAAAGMMGSGCLEPSRREITMVAMCGLDCAGCPAFIARKTDDQALRVKTAAEWSTQYNAAFRPEDINCVGCLQVEGAHIGHCSECEIRKCGLARKVENCALCSDYPCEKIAKFLANVPPAKANLGEIRRAHAR